LTAFNISRALYKSYEWRRRGMHIGYWWESQKEIGHYLDQDLGKWILDKLDWLVWTGLIWLRIETSGGLLLAR
jgi:hypothetical protein